MRTAHPVTKKDCKQIISDDKKLGHLHAGGGGGGQGANIPFATPPLLIHPPPTISVWSSKKQITNVQDEGSNDNICTFFIDKLQCECAQNCRKLLRKVQNEIATGNGGGGGSEVDKEPGYILALLPPPPSPTPIFQLSYTYFLILLYSCL